MASLISAGTSTNTAVSITGDTTGALALATNNGTVAVTIDTSQVVTLSNTILLANNNYIGFKNTSGSVTSSIFNDTSNDLWLYNGSATNTRFYTNATERMRINSNGQVLVNTTSATTYYSGASTVPPQHLVVADYDTYYAVSANNTANPGYNFAGPNSAGNRFRYAAIQAPFTTTTAGSEAGALAFHTSSGGANIAERVRIASDGTVRIGMQNFGAAVSSSNFGMSLNNTNAGSYSYAYSTTTNTHWGFGNGNGGTGSIQTNGSTTSFNTTSDHRLKENVAPMTGGLARVQALKPVTYKWKVDGADGEGFIAHELQEVCSHAVTGEKDAVDENGDPIYQQVDTSFLVATLTAAIQELKTIVDAQAVEIAALKAKVGS